MATTSSPCVLASRSTVLHQISQHSGCRRAPIPRAQFQPSELPHVSGRSLVAARSPRQASASRARDRDLRKCSSSPRLVVLAAGGDQEKKSWDVVRFVQTWQFFNEPFNFGKFVEGIVSKLSGREAETNSAPGRDVVLVSGATGGLGKRVVEVLRAQGIPVRALVRNVDKARALLGPNTELVVADVTQKATLLPEYFKGVRAVINAIAVIVGPAEGDTADRQKYFQGIKFFDPEIKGDSPETVELNGIKNLIEAVKGNVGVEEGVTLYKVDASGPTGPAWGSLDDVVMGGVSESSLQVNGGGSESGGPVGVFRGNLSTANSGGFASVRTKNFTPQLNLAPYDGLEFRIRGNGRRFKVIIRTSADWDSIGYTGSFDTIADQWQTIRLPFSELSPVFRAKTVMDAAPFNPSSVFSLQILYSKFDVDGKLNPAFEPGPFELRIASIRSYMKEPVTPRFVHVSSAGVTRPDRPGLDLSKQPPAVRLNSELGFILTYKLRGEDAVRESGIPFTIVRPVALTEEPHGADLVFDQGDNITGKIAREEVARILVAALKTPATTNTTFEVKSTVPFSEPFVTDSAKAAVDRDYAGDFQMLKTGVTGKELMKVPVA